MRSSFLEGHLPFRLFAFTLVTHLELLMAALIHAKYPMLEDEQQWLQYLTSDRQQKVKDKQQERKQGNIELPLLEFTDFCDKRDIVRKIRSFSGKFEKDLGKIEKYVRNTVVHAADYGRDNEEMEQFIRLIILTQEWISKLESS